MVGAERCQGCKMNFCKVCLDGTDYCDRCRTLRQASGQSVKSNRPAAGSTTMASKQPPPPPKPGTGKTPTGSLQRATTGALDAKTQPPANPAQGNTAGSRGPTDPRLRALAAKQGGTGKPLAAAAESPARKLPWPVIGVAAVVVLFGAWKVFIGGKPALSDQDALAALRAEMAMVQQAAVKVQAQSGSYPSTSAAILDEMKKEGVNPDDLPLTLKLTVNTEATQPLEITYKVVGESFEIRALDSEGRPLADNGRDVVLRPPPTRERKS